MEYWSLSGEKFIEELLVMKVDKMGTIRMMKGIVPEFKSKNSEYEVLDEK